MSTYYFLIDHRHELKINAGNGIDEERFADLADGVADYTDSLFRQEFEPEHNHREWDEEFRDTPHDELTTSMLAYLEWCRTFLRDAPQLHSCRLLALVYYLNVVERTDYSDDDWDYCSEYTDTFKTYQDYPTLNPR